MQNELNRARALRDQLLVAHDRNSEAAYKQQKLEINQFLKRLNRRSTGQGSQATMINSLNSTVREINASFNKYLSVKPSVAAGSKVEENQRLEFLKQQAALSFRINRLITDLRNYQQSIDQEIISLAEEDLRRATVQILLILAFSLLGTTLLVYLINADVSVIARLNKALNEEKSRAEQLASAREAFLANMSHEIRTPLTAVVGYSEQLRRPAITNQQRAEYLSALDKATRHLMHLVNEILDASQLEVGKMKLEKVSFSVTELVFELEDVFRMQAHQKKLQFYCQSGVKQAVIGDPYRLKQMLYNLLSNAIKFTEEGSVSLQVEVVAETDNQYTLSFIVQDTGIGIHASRKESIFHTFSSSAHTPASYYGGTGLGLSIVQKLATLMEGKIYVDSEPGTGSTFTLTLRFEKSALTHQEHSSDRTILPLGDVLKPVLIIDDEPGNRHLLACQLKELGFQIGEAATGNDALQYLEENEVSLVFCDLRLPDVQPYPLLKSVRARTKEPIVAFTAQLNDRKLLERFDEVLRKPFMKEEVDRILVHVFGENEELFTTPQKHENSSGEIERLYSLKKVKKFTGNDQLLLDEFLDDYLKSFKEGLKNMKTAVAEKDAEGLSFTAHKLLPNTLQLEIWEAVPQLEELESNSYELLKKNEAAEKVQQLQIIYQRLNVVLSTQH